MSDKTVDKERREAIWEKQRIENERKKLSEQSDKDTTGDSNNTESN